MQQNPFLDVRAEGVPILIRTVQGQKIFLQNNSHGRQWAGKMEAFSLAVICSCVFGAMVDLACVCV